MSTKYKEVLITRKHESEFTVTIEATCGKKTGVVSFRKNSESMHVLCVNASHMAWCGGGRYVRSLGEALECYKSPEMKAIIRAAVEAANIKEVE